MRIWAILLLVIFVLTGCGTRQPDSVSWNEVVRMQCMNGETEIEKALAKVVSLDAEEKSNDVLLITINAPDIYDDLIDWMNNVSEEDFSEKALESEILKLLSETKPTKNIVELSYTGSEEDVKISYTHEFANLISCGMVRFYNDTMSNAINELGGNDQ